MDTIIGNEHGNVKFKTWIAHSAFHVALIILEKSINPLILFSVYGQIVGANWAF